MLSSLLQYFSKDLIVSMELHVFLIVSMELHI